jgi:hypothetical protein
MLFQKPRPDIISNKVIMLGVGSSLSAIVPITAVFVMSMHDASFHRTTILVKLRIGSIMSVLYSLSTTIPSAIMSLPSQTMYIVKSPIGVFLYDNSFKLTSGIIKVMVRNPKAGGVAVGVVAYAFSSAGRKEDVIQISSAILTITDTAVHDLATGRLKEYVVQKATGLFSGYMMFTIIGLTISFEMDRRKTLKRSRKTSDKKSNKIIKAGVQSGQENGDIIINLTNMVSNQKTKIEELEQRNKSLNNENNSLFIETKDLTKKLDLRINALTTEKAKNITMRYELDSLKKVISNLTDSLKAKEALLKKGDANTAPPKELTDEEQLQQLIEKERQERIKRREEEERKKKEEEEKGSN